jgi:hypothetical protein
MITDGSNLFGVWASDAGAVSNDITMDDQLSLLITSEPNVDQVCSELQSKLKLDLEHLKIALLTSKVSFTPIGLHPLLISFLILVHQCSPTARHASIIFSIAAFSQLGVPRPVAAATHLFDERFRVSNLSQTQHLFLYAFS